MLQNFEEAAVHCLNNEWSLVSGFLLGAKGKFAIDSAFGRIT